MKNNTNNDEDDDSPMKQQRSEINMIIASLALILTSTISFLVGKMIISRSSQYGIVSNINSKNDDFTTNTSIKDFHPPLSLQNGKLPPLHRYVGMEFYGANAYGQSRNSHLSTNFGSSEQVCEVSSNGDKSCEIDNTQGWIDQEYIEHDNDEYRPAGQHLIIDISHVDREFLNSDVRLAQALVQVVNLAEVTLLSYHCHNLNPQGVSCAGVLLESHIAFHTWPEAGVIMLDLFTCGSGKLVPLLPYIEELFAIPQVRSLEKPVMKWMHKLRGFDSEDDDNNLMKVDIGDMLGSSCDIKQEIASVQTSFQRIDVFDLQYSSKYKISQRETSYREENPSLFQPQRIVYLDGVIQSTRHNLSAYHEALVHPVMFAHNNPKRVAIIGGGEGATLMEVLKHNTLEKVQMIEIDEEMVKTSRQYLQEWSDCSDIIGSEKWCGDDSRSEIFYEDALAWFIDRYSPHGKLAQEHHSKLDVIIMDAL
jgi:spermidine synthase